MSVSEAKYFELQLSGTMNFFWMIDKYRHGDNLADQYFFQIGSTLWLEPLKIVFIEHSPQAFICLRFCPANDHTHHTHMLQRLHGGKAKPG